MNTAKLKNIVISILVLLNACLLFLLLSRSSTAQQDYERTVTQLTALYASDEISLSAAVIPHDVFLPDAQPQRDTAAEASLAAALLGDGLSVEASGGIYRYENGSGSCTFRGNGSVEALLERRVDDPSAFCRGVGADFGYGEWSEKLDGGSGTVSAVRMLDDAPIFGCTLTFCFRENVLVALSGSFLSFPASFDSYSECDPITALVHFFDYRGASGAVCTEVTNVRCGYLLESSSAGTQRLLRAVCIDTDVNSYCVSEESGEVQRLS